MQARLFTLLKDQGYVQLVEGTGLQATGLGACIQLKINVKDENCLFW